LVWDVGTGRIKRRLDLGASVMSNCAALASNDHWMVAGFGGKDEPGAPFEDCCVRAFDAETGATMARWEHDSPVTSLAVSHDSRFVLAGEESGTIRLWELPQA
jgi:WD40 repeat protein